MSATQLERSVLEAKEREELFAIAAALGTKATTRAKKADLITQILRATGVEEADAPEPEDKPKRTRARKSAAAVEEAPSADAPSEVATTTGGQLRLSPVDEQSSPAERTNGSPRRRGATTRAAAVASSEAPVGAETPELSPPEEPSSRPEQAVRPQPPDGSASTPARGRPESASVDESPRRNPLGSSGPPRNLGSGPGARTGGPTRGRPGANGNANGNGSPAGRQVQPEAAPSAAHDQGQHPGQSGGGQSSGGQSSGGQSSGGQSSGGQQNGGQGHGGQPNGGQTNGGANGGQGSQHNAGQGNASQNNPGQGNAGQNNPGQGNAGQGGQGGPGLSASAQARFDAEPGNRRNRRRRGRDRPERTDRELQGSQPVAENQPFNGEPIEVSGFLDLREEGYGFLRTSGFIAGSNDVYVSVSQVRRFAMRKGDFVEGASRPPASNEKYPALLRVDTVSGLTPDEARSRPRFENLTPLFPDQKLHLEMPGDPANLTARIVDLISPIGKGQRGLIVSPPKAGKTTVLKQIAHSIEANNPEVHLMVLLVDERPEEVTDMRRSVKGEVIASTFDRPSEEHTQVTELAIERAKRLVEAGRDVVIVLDGITRLARAYNLAQPATGRIMSGGIDTGALYPPKKFFGAARNVEEGGSLTILATALVETGSKMDEVIFEEFKGTGNMELRLDRRLAERRIYPAIDVAGSSTRHEELLFDRVQLQQVWKLRRVLGALGSEGSHAAGLELLIDRIKMTKSNDEFLAEIAKNPAPNI